MIRRTTVELDDDLVAAAKAALGAPTTRSAIEAALRKVISEADTEADRRRQAFHRYLEELPDIADLDVMAADEMWR